MNLSENFQLYNLKQTQPNDKLITPKSVNL
jgi:hypothetical protein